MSTKGRLRHIGHCAGASSSHCSAPDPSGRRDDLLRLRLRLRRRLQRGGPPLRHRAEELACADYPKLPEIARDCPRLRSSPTQTAPGRLAEKKSLQPPARPPGTGAPSAASEHARSASRTCSQLPLHSCLFTASLHSSPAARAAPAPSRTLRSARLRSPRRARASEAAALQRTRPERAQRGRTRGVLYLAGGQRAGGAVKSLLARLYLGYISAISRRQESPRPPGLAALCGQPRGGAARESRGRSAAASGEAPPARARQSGAATTGPRPARPRPSARQARRGADVAPAAAGSRARQRRRRPRQ